MAKFFGWIPNVAGKLSFTLSGTSAYPRQFYHSTNIGAGGRVFVGFQHRNLSDTTIPFLTDWPFLRSWVDSIVFNKDGNFVFLCCMKISIDGERAVGLIYAFKRAVWREIFETIAGPVEAAATWPDDKDIRDVFDQRAVGRSAYCADFTIQRNGVTEIDTVEFRDRDGSSDELEHAFAAQSYFCLRDLLHTHRFHSPSSDTIIDVYRDFPTLKRQVNFGLMRRALSARRVQTVEAHQRAIGIISYLRAFRENIMTQQEREKLHFSLEAVLASIQAAIPIVAAKEKYSLRGRLDRFRAWVIGTVAILFSYASLIKDSKVLVPDNLSWFKEIFAFIQEQFGFALIAIVLLLIFVQLLLSVRIEKRDAIVRTTSRLALAFPVRRFAIFEIVLAMVLLATSLGIMAWLFHTVLSIK
ncbi:MAG: hypothetical protein EOS50_16965 [Mesorhizobium sp.]|nr:MAG: hypothetical protein EOS50_16965 [Mesorhizobium sp.]